MLVITYLQLAEVVLLNNNSAIERRVMYYIVEEWKEMFHSSQERTDISKVAFTWFFCDLLKWREPYCPSSQHHHHHKSIPHIQSNHWPHQQDLTQCSVAASQPWQRKNGHPQPKPQKEEPTKDKSTTIQSTVTQQSSPSYPSYQEVGTAFKIALIKL